MMEWRYLFINDLPDILLQMKHLGQLFIFCIDFKAYQVALSNCNSVVDLSAHPTAYWTYRNDPSACTLGLIIQWISVQKYLT